MNAAALISTGDTRAGEQLQAHRPQPGLPRRPLRGGAPGAPPHTWAGAGTRQQLPSPGSKRFTAPRRAAD